MSEQTGAIGEERAVRIGRVLDSFVSRRERGERVSEAELLGRHPDLADDLRLHLDLLGDLPPVSQRIDALIAMGLLTRSDDARYLAELGEYKIIDYLGRGGMGIVLKAYEPKLDRVVALKILRPDLADDSAVIRRFAREAKAAATLKHSNIVTVYTVGEHNGTHFIAMEYVAGPTLSELIRNTGSLCPTDVAAETGAGQPSEPEAQAKAQSEPAAQARGLSPALDTATIREIFRQLLSALAAAHDAGLIHRDVKSSNILLELPRIRTRSASEGPAIRTRSVSDGPNDTDSPSPQNPEPQTLNPEPSLTIKLADFGLARLAGSQTTLTKADSILGTPEYMSPEQARGDADIDHRSDLYSAGVVLYEMLTGRTPFKADTPTAVIHQIIHVEPSDPRTVNKDADAALASLALRLMAKEPGERLASADEALAALKAGARVRRPITRRHRLRLFGILFAVGALGLAVGTGAWLRGSSNTTAAPKLFRPAGITGVKVDPGNQTRLIVERGYGNESVFHIFPEAVGEIGVCDFFDFDGDGTQAVAVGLQRPHDGHNVIVYDASGEVELASWDLSDEPHDRKWPDCALARHWLCGHIVPIEFDGEPGMELLIDAGHPDEYPRRLSVVDPRTGDVLSTFWHMGQFGQVHVVSNLLGPGRDGVIVFGVNNKLDGFFDQKHRVGDDKPRTKHDKVSFIAILDPHDMNGLGPPCTKRVDIPPANVVSYAFLDMLCSWDDEALAFVNIAHPNGTDNRELASIERVVIEPTSDTPDNSPLLKVHIVRPRMVGGGAIFTVGKSLKIESDEMTVQQGKGNSLSEKDWRDRWKVIVRDDVDIKP